MLFNPNRIRNTGPWGSGLNAMRGFEKSSRQPRHCLCDNNKCPQRHTG